jgi:hypothetical protein
VEPSIRSVFFSFVAVLQVFKHHPLGPIFSLKLLGQNIVVLSSHKAATDLLGTFLYTRLSNQISDIFLERRSNIYSNRPQFVMAGEILTSNMFLALTQYGDLYGPSFNHLN